jgi:RNA polymerase sigma factor (sigma-70 family)
MTKPRTVVPAAPKSDDSTAELLTRFRTGDSSAEDEIVRRELPALRRWARGRLPRYARGGTDTEDLIQETFAHALTRLTAFYPSHPGALQAYLRVAVQNRVRDQLRRVARRPKAEELQEMSDRGPTPFETALAEETHALYLRGLGSLRPVDQAMLRARIDRQWDYDKIARAFGKSSPDAARMAVTRALRRLLDELQVLGQQSVPTDRDSKGR